MNEQTKPWWQSRTLRVNLAIALLAAVESNFGLLQPHLPVNFYALVAFALPIVNTALRIITSTGLTLK